MKSNIIFFLLLVLGFCSVSAQDKFTIEAKLNKSINGRAMLNYVNENGKSVKDSAVVRKGKFVLNGSTAYANKATLSIKTDTAAGTRGSVDYQIFYLEGGRYKIKGEDKLANAKITGARSQEEYLAYQNLIDKDLKSYQSLANEFMKVRSAKDSARMKAISDEVRPIMARIDANVDSFIAAHPDSYVAVDAVLENRTAVIDPQTFSKYYDPFTPGVLASFSGKRLTDRYDKARQIAIGKTVDFTQTLADGKEFKLSSLRGKYVLVDFWASWCVPCRAENPHLLKAYDKLKQRNFEIVGVSLDETEAAWLKAVNKDGMPWIQVSDLKGFKTDVAVKFGITAIPQNFLIDPKGVIIAKNLRGEDVDTKIAALLP